MKIWIDGALRAAAEATVSVLDHGLTVGDGVFETVKTVAGTAFALDRHVARLARSARGLGLPEPDGDRVRRACAEVVAANPAPLGRLRITYTGGVSPLGSDRGEAGATLVVALAPTTPHPPATAVVTVPWARNDKGALTGLKTTSYAENVLALARAKERGATEALFANTRGHLCEGTGSNVFVVVGGELLTPPLDSGCLAGITRQLVLEWTGAREAELPMEILREAEEVFLTSTVRDVQGVHRVDDRDLPGTPGPVTAKAMRVFAERAAADPNP
ncbi:MULTISPECIES: aminotransferase class IV [Streptomycetaceae]|uniref:aminodeoxychorismate lyase n=1 Tax=Streptantibioticus cattleyicolor (strain ATCC 35852 / DSM 46488 / JCM 4925 / NBRC 14057 / NRRL 8057) TaxID=1003195 RepID=F8K3V3_STREN|nr:aminodeoxychorismate lyase [Streptantibioticus cattleyicolor]AEW97648.1 aminotransferase [Streptantibioticus cattleyicolor NRRL 8057 = DSM 46488]MYS62076.1 4-amino-4-deoxychorismate lyase [Streptomyces sp. SID5468]CCB77969.1 ADC lyase [Streptantibioticus cattleyicolor NRRL 8057 = DSM 46488]